MAKKKWIVLPGGRIKRWKKTNDKPKKYFWSANGVPPHWYRNQLNRRERRKIKSAISKREAHRFPYIHPRIAGWYW
ncbi:MAG: hypothetical protein M3384_03395 [Acidobacteriota bacterium]|nr:hypothetical protein [Acidobacteriota bacterium]